MEEAELRHLLRSGKERRFRRGCPGEARLAAYADRRLGGADRASVEAHLAGCRRCLAQLSFLTRSANWPPPAEAPAHLLVRARKLAPSTQPPAPLRGWRWAATAATVCLLLTVGFIATLRLRPPDAPRAEQKTPLIAQQQPADVAVPSPHSVAPTPDTARAATPAGSAAPRPTAPAGGPRSARTPATALRRADVNGFSPLLLAPRDGEVLKRGVAEFRWQPAADALFYEVFVVTAAGDIVLEQRSEATRLPLPADAPLTPGAKYFVWIRAHLREGKTVNSSVVSFRVAD